MATESITQPPRTKANGDAGNSGRRGRRVLSGGDSSAPGSGGGEPLLDGAASFDRYDPGSDFVRKVAADAWREAGHDEDDPGDVVTLTI